MQLPKEKIYCDECNEQIWQGYQIEKKILCNRCLRSKYLIDFTKDYKAIETMSNGRIVRVYYQEG